MFEKFWGRLIAWLFKVTSLSRYTTKQAEDIPDKILKNKFYLIGKDTFVWCGVMLCPCGCQEVIHLNLLPKGRPKWVYQLEKDGTISIHPSIWRTTGCRSHFFLKKGKINWCKSL